MNSITKRSDLNRWYGLGSAFWGAGRCQRSLVTVYCVIGVDWGAVSSKFVVLCNLRKRPWNEGTWYILFLGYVSWMKGWGRLIALIHSWFYHQYGDLYMWIELSTSGLFYCICEAVDIHSMTLLPSTRNLQTPRMLGSVASWYKFYVDSRNSRWVQRSSRTLMLMIISVKKLIYPVY